jgi:hypothetical protein
LKQESSSFEFRELNNTVGQESMKVVNAKVVECEIVGGFQQ